MWQNVEELKGCDYFCKALYYEFKIECGLYKGLTSSHILVFEGRK